MIAVTLTACYNSSTDTLSFSDSEDIKEYYEVAKNETNPYEAYKDAITQLKIMHQNKTDIKTISYDSCANTALKEKINSLKNNIELNVIDYGYLDYLLNDTIDNSEYAVMWDFMRSENFEML